MASNLESRGVLKDLASGDRKIREKALSQIIIYLTSTTTANSLPFSPDLLKIWKALFYTIHHTDRPIPQQQLSLRTLTQDLLLKVPKGVFVRFLAAFWKTLIGMWGDLQGLRLDKYLFLVRCYVRGSFQYLERETKWQDDGGGGRSGGELTVEHWCEMMTGNGDWKGENVGVMDTSDAKVPDGLRYHVLDVWVDGLMECERWQDGREKVMGIVELIAKQGGTKVLRERAKIVLKDERLAADEHVAVDGGHELDNVDARQEIVEDGDEEFEGFPD